MHESTTFGQVLKLLLLKWVTFPSIVEISSADIKDEIIKIGNEKNFDITDDLISKL